MDTGRIDAWLDKHLDELAKGRCPWANSRVKRVHTNQYLDIMKVMFEFEHDLDDVHAVLVVLHDVQDPNEGEGLFGLCRTQYFLDRNLLFIEYKYMDYPNDLNDPSIKFFVIQKLDETKEASDKLLTKGYYKEYPDNLQFRKIRGQKNEIYG